LQFAISTIGNSAGLIGASYMIVNEAGYMIVNELALSPGAMERTPLPASLAELIHRALAAPDPCARDFRLAETVPRGNQQ
jgi:hypothetical protein